ncbi:MAG: two-component system response regulator, partial [Paenibacillus sp.]|nr:two-component system response regulator [Paenibacillus sp.]
HPVVRELVAIVEREPDKDLSLNTMAERFALHPFHLSRLFKKETGAAYSDYVMTIRMTRAKRLLEAGHKVYETASRCGFKDAGNFSKAFSKYWGIPPVGFKPKRE